jgi:hypothetical protein
LFGSLVESVNKRAQSCTRHQFTSSQTTHACVHVYISIEHTLHLWTEKKLSLPPPPRITTYHHHHLSLLLTPPSSPAPIQKVRDDPLFAIKKKEQEGVRNLLNNPVRLKQLQQMREAARGKDKKEKKAKKEKKEKKNKKEKKEKRDKSDRRSRSRSSSPEGPSRDDELRRMVAAAAPLLRPTPRAPVDASPPPPPAAALAPVRSGDRDGHHHHHHHRHTHDSHTRGRSRSPERSRRRSRSRSRSPVRSRGGRRSRSRSPVDRHKRVRSRSPPPADRHRDRDRPRDEPRRGPAPPPSSSSSGASRRPVAPASGNDDREAERQRKLEEMRANASWHDDERAERAREHAAREEEQAKKVRVPVYFPLQPPPLPQETSVMLASCLGCRACGKSTKEWRRDPQLPTACPQPSTLVAAHLSLLTQQILSHLPIRTHAQDALRETDGRGQASFMGDFNRTAFESATAGSVGDRIARGRHYIQRTTAALDSQSFKRS